MDENKNMKKNEKVEWEGKKKEKEEEEKWRDIRVEEDMAMGYYKDNARTYGTDVSGKEVLGKEVWANECGRRDEWERQSTKAGEKKARGGEIGTRREKKLRRKQNGYKERKESACVKKRQGRE